MFPLLALPRSCSCYCLETKNLGRSRDGSADVLAQCGSPAILIPASILAGRILAMRLAALGAQPRSRAPVGSRPRSGIHSRRQYRAWVAGSLGLTWW